MFVPTVETTMTRNSWPWNSSTEPTLMSDRPVLLSSSRIFSHWAQIRTRDVGVTESIRSKEKKTVFFLQLTTQQRQGSTEGTERVSPAACRGR